VRSNQSPAIPSKHDLKCLPAALVCVLLLSGCTRHEVSAGLPSAHPPMPQAAREAVAEEPAQRAKSLAYEHTLSIELQKDALSGRLGEVRTICESRKELACTVLDVSFDTEYEVPAGHIRMRLAPRAVDSVIEIAAKNGRITSRGTHGEDLAEPIFDTERELSLLVTHRDRLSEFLKRNDLKVDQVISLSKEISSAQTQIDALNTQKANLQRRVDTDLLTINFAPPKEAYAAEQTPILDAIHSFGVNFRTAVAQVIQFTATLIPWLVIIIPGVVLLRLFWGWITQWLGRRDQRR
jgi:Domain of unknown function (DUF4349)